MKRVTCCRLVLAAISTGALFSPLISPPQAAADPFKLGVQEKNYIESGGYQYPAPQMVAPVSAPPQQPKQAHASSTGLRGGAQVSQPRAPIQANIQQRAPMQLNVQQSVALPPGYLGTWLVNGNRQKVDAEGTFQSDAERAFSQATNNTWTISGNPASGYTLSSNEGVTTQLWVDKVANGTAFIRYQHPIKNVMAQEAIVLSLTPDGAQFQGLERISIVKQGEPPRAKVTYQLMGQRQR